MSEFTVTVARAGCLTPVVLETHPSNTYPGRVIAVCRVIQGALADRIEALLAYWVVDWLARVGVPPFTS